jgi:hypothetical protein
MPKAYTPQYGIKVISCEVDTFGMASAPFGARVDRDKSDIHQIILRF